MDIRNFLLNIFGPPTVEDTDTVSDSQALRAVADMIENAIEHRDVGWLTGAEPKVIRQAAQSLEDFEYWS